MTPSWIGTARVAEHLVAPGGHRPHLQSLRDALVSFAAFAAAWQGASLFLPKFKMPGLQYVAESLLTLHYDYVLISLTRVTFALALAFAVGMAGALAMYLYRGVERYIMPMVRLVMAVPATCWIVFSILWFKGVELRIGFVLVVCCAPIFLVDILDGVRGIPRELRDMIWSFRPGLRHFLRMLVLPAIMPVIFTSLKINLSQAIRLVTFAELVGAVSGIGYGLNVAQELFSVADVFAWTLVLIVILTVALEGLALMETRMLRWRA
jgi:ABC-type nitrate/sulfonate/bicarbonate transport system permease component